MELKSTLTIATLICVGLFATGCSQQQTASSQQTTSSQQATEPVQPSKPPVARPPVQRPVKPYRPPVMPPVKVPPVKAKGNYKGAVKMDRSSRSMMQQYQR